MADVKVYSYAKCSTCRKALKFLESKGVEHKVIDITEQPPTKAELKKMLGYYDGELKRLFNTSGVQYRELDIKSKLPNMTKDEAIRLLSENGKLVKRPFVLWKQSGLVGFKDVEWNEFVAAR